MVVCFHENGIGESPGHVGLPGRTQPRQLGSAQRFERRRRMGFVPPAQGFAEAEIGELVDVSRLGSVDQQIAQKTPQPGVARFGIGGEPDQCTHVMTYPSRLSAGTASP